MICAASVGDANRPVLAHRTPYRDEQQPVWIADPGGDAGGVLRRFLKALKRDGWRRLNVPADYAPFAHGNFPTPSGKCEFRSAALAAQGQDPLPDYVPPRESVATNPTLARRFPLAFISPPARNFLNSSFANLPASGDAYYKYELLYHRCNGEEFLLDPTLMVRRLL